LRDNWVRIEFRRLLSHFMMIIATRPKFIVSITVIIIDKQLWIPLTISRAPFLNTLGINWRCRRRS
jgi:hypothetical protein